LGETTFKPPVPPRSMSRSAAAAILHNRRASSAEARRRKSNAASLLAGDADNSRARRIRVPEGGVAGYLRLPVRLAAGLDALPSARRVQALGVARSYPLALPDLPGIAARAGGGEHRWPGADVLVRELVTLPTHSLLSAAEREEIRESVLRVR
jgi:hypothetical protein